MPGPVRHLRLPFHPGYILVFAVMALFSYAYVHKMHQITILARQDTALQTQNGQTIATNARVRKAIAWYRTDQYVEDTARSDLAYTMPGDVSVEVRPIHPAVVKVRRAPPQPTPTPLPSWQQWWNAFTP